MNLSHDPKREEEVRMKEGDLWGTKIVNQNDVKEKKGKRNSKTEPSKVERRTKIKVG